MAVTASGLHCATIIDIFDATQLAVDLSLTSNKWAMFTNSITPDFEASAANAQYGAGAYAANEVSGTGYTAGGTVVASPTLTSTGGTVTFDQADTSWATSTITAARCALLYADALAGNNAVALVNFAADYSTVAGTFAIVWNASGVFTWDLTP